MDLEGCLVPEIWINLARKTGISELQLTTRDIADYDELMIRRLEILNKHGIDLKQIQTVISRMRPLEGALDFLKDLRARTQLIILSDTFYEFAAPLMEQLNHPTLFCHTLQIQNGSRIAGYRLRVADSKKGAVQAFQQNGFFVIAIGDSFNDISMLQQAERGLLFRAPPNVIETHPYFPVYHEYSELLQAIHRIIGPGV